MARDYKGENPAEHRLEDGKRRGRVEAQLLLLPTPRATDGEKGVPNQRGSSGDLMMPSVAAKLLPPTPPTMDAKASGSAAYPATATRSQGTTLTDATVRVPERWGEYADAIYQWEYLTRPAPDPTEVGPKGAPRLAPAFSEWMMGLPNGHVTAVPGMSRNESLRAIGNGVCPQQAAAGIAHLMARVWARFAA